MRILQSQHKLDGLNTLGGFAKRHLFAVALLGWMVGTAWAQSPLLIYTDRRLNGFEDWSWATRNFSNTTPVHSGSYSISVSAATWQALSLHHAEFDVALYSNLTFWAHGGTTGGQRLQVVAGYGTNQGPAVALPTTLPANTWRQYSVSLGALGVADKTNVHRFNLQLASGGTSGTFYVDDIQLGAKTAPVLIQLSVDASQAIRSVDSRWFGVNTAIWDNDFGDNTTERNQTIGLLREMGLTTLRFPGGSLSDEYHWASNTSSTNTWQWNTSFSDFWRVATNVASEVFITVNYGSGTPAEAAGWVRHANLTNRLGFKYWEIGNENYGTWETDSNARPHDAYTYAVRAKEYLQQMKAADPTIKVGVVVATGEDSYQNGYSDHPALNPRTGQTHYGWTPVLLTTLKSLGVTPDFAVYHYYPQWTDGNNPSPNSDAFLLQCAVNWARDAADLRQQIADYFGPGGTNIELLVTENNSDAGAQGRQSTSLVNGLYYADSLGQLMKTEFNAFVWWDLRNGTDTKGSFDSSLYGWRTFGDLGMVNGPTTRLPAVYAAKLMSAFARAGDKVVSASSSYPLLSAYAARRANGVLSLLVLNKDTTTNFSAQIALNGFAPASSATIRFYGIPQDEATRTNGPATARDVATNSFAGAGERFTYDFPALSMTLFTLTPVAPQLAPLPASTQPSAFVFQLQGQPDVPYVLQSSSNLSQWVSDSTNRLVGDTLNVTNPVAPRQGMQFWRAVWMP